jgi:hypothetical protein
MYINNRIIQTKQKRFFPFFSFLNLLTHFPLFQLYLYNIIYVPLSHLTNNCNHTCDGCISELCNRFDGVCDIKDQCKEGLDGVKCDKGTCIIL